MNNLTTRKIILGLLVTLVLAFSVQGICEALTLSAKSDTTQIKQPSDVPFEIQFSVDLTRPTDINDFNVNSRHIKASATDIQNGNSGFVSSGTLISSGEDEYANGDTYYYSDPKVRNPLGVEDPATRTLTHEPSGDDYTYTQNRNWATETEAFYYNDEQINIAVSASGGAVDDVSITLKGTNYVVPSDANGIGLTEQSGILTSSMTLVCDISTAGSYTITIKDSTAEGDYPPGRAPVTSGAGIRPSEITFTLHVTAEQVEVGSTNNIQARNPTGGGVTPYLRVDTAKKIEKVSDDFVVTPPTGHLEIRYKIISGSGTLYAAETSTTGIYRGPNQDLTVHQSALVFLNTNGTTNENCRFYCR